jgi:C-terminal processing protease CtpA/Prc
MTVAAAKIRMMINMDMIGRLRPQDKGLGIFGIGTCQAFKNYFDSTSFGDLRIVSKEPGTGPSDQTAFYNRNIPVLYFFTGAHEDYHKPTDDVDKINFTGTARVAQIVADVVEYFDKYDSFLVFQKTKGTTSPRRRSRYTVTLGVMPDYLSDIKGMKIDGVTPGKPAEKAGIKTGDIIIKLGDIVIGDIYDNMNALGKFHKGDTTQVVVQRGSDTLELKVIF